jgi:hypothetical protein
MAGPVAARGQGLTIEVSQCADLEAPQERLACYDERVEAVRGARSAATNAPAEAPDARAPAAASSTTAPADPGETAPPDTLAKVAELRETVPNSLVITLDNGQVWRQTTPEYYALRAGVDVRINYSPRWRSYRLTNEALRPYIQFRSNACAEGRPKNGGPRRARRDT